jgi:ornithine cyclodeaminase/alanine dehydrogenase-like protein (mu-crystallin family)
VALLLDDADVLRLLDMRAAIGAVEDALRERGRGRAAASPRLSFAAGGDGVVVSAGVYPGLGAYGLRAYPVRIAGRIDVLSIWDAERSTLEAVVVGRELNPLRVGAIGGVVIHLLAVPEAAVVGVIGAGPQARMQVHAACAVRPVREVRVYRRDAAARELAAATWTRELGVEVRPTEDAEAAVRGADVVVTATVAAEPVLAADWLEPHALVNVLGPTGSSASEVPLALFERAALLVSDFPEQYERDDFLLHGTAHAARIVDLAELLVEPARPNGVAVFLSNGLSGTEVGVGRELARRAAAQGVGIELSL